MTFGENCKKCGGHQYSGLHPLMPEAFHNSCKCHDTCKCGRYIDDYGQFLGIWRSFMACNCSLKAQRIAERQKAQRGQNPKSYMPSWKSYLLNPDMYPDS